jgi:hypothetical protein
MFDEAGVFHLSPEEKTKILRMIDQDIVLVPTLEVYLADPYLLKAIEPETDVLNHAVFQAILGVIRFFHESGGIIAVGNDYGNPGVESGIPLREMDLLQAAGLSAQEVIEAATKHAAYVCGHGEELGTLEKGKLADLIVVDGNPLSDINTLDSLLYTLKDGNLVLSPEQEGNKNHGRFPAHYETLTNKARVGWCVYNWYHKSKAAIKTPKMGLIHLCTISF